MYLLIYTLIVFASFPFVAYFSAGITLLPDLNQRLDGFQMCNIRITAQFNTTDFDPLVVPTSLLDSKYRKNRRFFFYIWLTKAYIGNPFPFKYRGTICTLELVIHLGDESYNPVSQYHHEFYETAEPMDDKYLVIIRQHTKLVDEDHTKMWERQSLDNHKIFIWTVTREFDNLSMQGHSQDQHFQNTFFLYKSSGGTWIGTFKAHVLDVQPDESQIKLQMDTFATCFRKKVFWIPRVQPSYQKLHRSIKLPFDEINLNRDPSPDFYQFMTELLYRANSSQSTYVQYIVFGGSKGERPNQRFVLDETDSFNFITCHTTDTFWSTAELFVRPYQAIVWIGLVSSFLLSGIILFKEFRNNRVSRVVMHMVLNLIEVYVKLGHIHGPKPAFKILLTSWLLMSIILTHSYKGLINSYLSVPWAPKHTWNYFQELKDFQFYTRMSHTEDKLYWELCNQYAADWAKINITCKKELSVISPLVKQKIRHLNHLDNNTIAHLFDKQLQVISRNESNGVLTEFINGGKMAIAGSNTEINEILMEVRKKYKGLSVFRGKETLWSHHKDWQLPKISYSQPMIELTQMTTSGIYQFWKYWLRDRQYKEAKLRDENLASPHPLSLSSNVFFIFVILIIGLVASVISSLLEHTVYLIGKYGVQIVIKNVWRVRLFYCCRWRWSKRACF